MFCPLNRGHKRGQLDAYPRFERQNGAGGPGGVLKLRRERVELNGRSVWGTLPQAYRGFVKRTKGREEDVTQRRRKEWRAMPDERAGRHALPKQTLKNGNSIHSKT